MAILAFRRPIFQPAMRVITNITQAFPAVVTTSFAHNYKDGLIVRLHIPQAWGMQEANQLQGEVRVLTSTTFEVSIDTRLFSSLLCNIPYGSTDGSGNASGTVEGFASLTGLGQFFTIGTSTYTVQAESGALEVSGSGTGTFSMNNGNFTFSGAPANTAILWNPIAYPFNYQVPQVVPIGENNSYLNSATQNVLPYRS